MKDDVCEVEKEVPHICNNCEFNFGEVCAAHSSLYGYGGAITNEEATCDEWGISLHTYLDYLKD